MGCVLCFAPVRAGSRARVCGNACDAPTGLLHRVDPERARFRNYFAAKMGGGREREYRNADGRVDEDNAAGRFGSILHFAAAAVPSRARRGAGPDMPAGRMPALAARKGYSVTIHCQLGDRCPPPGTYYTLTTISPADCYHNNTRSPFRPVLFDRGCTVRLRLIIWVVCLCVCNADML